MACKAPVWFHIQTQSAVSRITILLAFQDSRVLVQKVGCQGSNVQFKREKKSRLLVAYKAPDSHVSPPISEKKAYTNRPKAHDCITKEYAI
jgi:hypothetical protein